MDEMEKLLAKLLWGSLQSMGLFAQKDMHLHPDAPLKQNSLLITDLKAQIINLYHRWLDESIAVLKRWNYLADDERARVRESCVIVDPTAIDMEALWKEWNEQKAQWFESQNLKAQVMLVEATMRVLPEILTGKVPATDIMFPNSSMDLVEGIYRHNIVADTFNEVLADTVIAYIEERLTQEPDVQIRIIEIGAGTGGTSTMLFKKLKPFQTHIREYCFTDISKAFLMRAEAMFGPQNQYLTYHIFNVEKSFEGQGIQAGDYDLAIAANVLHATKNIHQTIRNVKTVLKKNGLLLLNEISCNSLFSHLTFGLLEGWWRYEDPELRIPGCPGLYPETWQAVLEREGFRSIFFPAGEEHQFGQQIVVAESDGVVRQKQSSAFETAISSGNQKTKVMRNRSAEKTPSLSIVQEHHLTIPKPNLNLSDSVKAEPDITGQVVEDYIRETIIENLSESLKIDIQKISTEESFADYGVDSITGINLIQTINRSLQIELKTTDLFDYSSVNQLVRYILSQNKDAIATTLGQSIRPTETRQSSIPFTDQVSPEIGSTGTFPGNKILPEFHIEREAGNQGPVSKEAIAIIGMSGRFAKSKSVTELWKHLANGTDLIEEVSRWDLPQSYLNQPNTCKHGSFIEDIDQFDPYFFNISGLEANFMDPQQRLFLEESWKALEDAGYVGNIGGRLCGVYLGYNCSDYLNLLGENRNIPAQAMWGNAGSIIPARIAYYLNLQGPAITVDTACSSSLVAIHLACQGLWAGETELALAGGVYIQCTPSFYLSAGKAGMLSPTGYCYTFDERADGFVPGEGVGVVVLKRFQEAIAAGDHIYGVIRGTGINQDGTTNGITAPSANSQERLERFVYDSFGIHPEQIQMVEAHGTGTKLGDPIEFEALTRAFRYYTDEKEYCAIGSIKTNLGHTTAAAGVAGLIKILLSLEHKKIPASLHFETGNSHIKFSGSPFYVNTQLREWEVEEGRKRCAAISAFGFSGTNAHIVIEEAPAIKREHPEKPGYLIVLSARTSEQLRRQVEQMVEFCELETQVEMGNISYTLLLGRRHLNHRLACAVRNRTELVALFRKWLEKGKSTQIYVSELGEKERREQPSLKQYGNECIRNCQINEQTEKYLEQLAVIAELHIQGYELEYEQLFAMGQYRRISLPTYPFAKERYWLPESDLISRSSVKTGGGVTGAGITNLIHPLLHQNTSDLLVQRYSSTFTGKEFFLKDHVVMNQSVLPGVAYLEMARAAVEKATGTASVPGVNQTGILLKNVVWVQPIVVEEPVHVHIILSPEENGEIAYEICSSPSEDGNSKKVEIEPVIHCQGRAVLNSIIGIPSLDLNTIQVQCNQNIFSTAEVYQFLKMRGFDYGLGHQGIEKVYVGLKQVLAKLSLPASVSDTKNQYVLHPSIMDSAVQAAIGFMMSALKTVGKTENSDPVKPALPFALQELEIFGQCVSSMWVLIRIEQGIPSGRDDKADKLWKLNIDLCDETGKICVRLKGYSSRILDSSRNFESKASPVGTLLLEIGWKEQQVVPETPIPGYTQHLVILCELEGSAPEDVAKNITTEMKGIAPVSRCLSLQSRHKGIDKRYETYVSKVFEEIQSILKEKPTGPVLIQIVVSSHGERQLLSGLSGLLKTARLENPKLLGQVIEVDQADVSKAIAEKLRENSCYPAAQQIRYQDGKRYIISWSEAETVFTEKDILWKTDGVYLITGGAGGLGLILAGEIARKAKDSTMILVGRSELSEGKRSQLKELQNLGVRLKYKPVDVSDRKAVMALFQSIREEYGGLHGIIHSAGVIKDNFIIKKTKDELSSVLAPKVAGLVNLDEASKDLPLDFFILFSALAGNLGNLGQADYAAANAFMDAYASYRNHLVSLNQRQGRTLSIDWPLWRNGGMHVNEETEKIMLQNTGMIAMRTQTGIQTLYQAFNCKQNQVMVMEGNLNQLRAVFLEQPNFQDDAKTGAFPSTVIEENRTDSAMTQDILQEKATNYFQKLLSTVIRIPAHRIEADTPMEKYGIDSIMVVQLTNELEKVFGSLSKTLFFEYQTIRELTSYFLEFYREQLIKNLGIEEKQTVTIENNSGIPFGLITSNVRSSKHSRFGVTQPPLPGVKVTGSLDIAIIGVSGRYPKANNIQEYWRNLQEGRDCITEIPRERWDHSLFFDEDKDKLGKTYSKWGGFLEGVAEFDPLFFNIAPREAEIMDPQERLFLECVYETLEDAGYTRNLNHGSHGFSLGSQGSGQGQGFGSVGVYVGVMYNEYQLYGAEEQIQGHPIALSGSSASIANRVSYFCNFHGPSVTVDTMCSSSLTAIHFACQSIQCGNCELVIAGGVNVSIHPNKYLMLGQGKFASSKGRCESFGEGGDGYVPGEGVGAVLLKPLSKAIADGDHIYGVIKGTAVNHGGKTNGYTVPNPNAQSRVIGQALNNAGIDPRTISYIEAHGTGTSLGDPIEITGLTKAFREFTNDNQFCAIGSAKSNIGHCESAAGIAGVTKVLLQMQNRQLVPSIHSEVLNPNIDFGNTPFIVQRALVDWKRPVINEREFPRRAGVSSFGAGGSNAHIVIEEYMPEDTSIAMDTRNSEIPAMIVLSAKNEERLREQVERLLAAIKERQFPDTQLDNIAYTLQVGREAMEERLAMIVGSMKELEDKLQGFVDGQDNIPDLYRGQVKRNQEILAALTTDEEMRETIDKWIQRKKHGKLLDFWVKGLVIDWNMLYDKIKPRRISLPTYPFIKESYWIPKRNRASEAVSLLERKIQTSILNSQERRNETQVETYMLAPIWDMVPVPKGQSFPSPTDSLIIVGGTKDNHNAFKQRYPRAQLLEIQSKDTIDTITKKLAALGTVNHIIWIAPDQPLQSVAGNLLIEKQNQGVLQVFRMIKALLRLGYGHMDLGFSLITTQTQPIFKGEAVNPTHASIYGFAGSLAKEYPNWKLRVIDLEATVQGSKDWPVADIFNLPPDSQGNSMVYRGGQWYRQQLLPIQRPVLNRTLYRKSGVYVVIGGAGGIGEAWSEYMIGTYQAQIIWIGRRPKDDAIQAKLDRLAGLGPAPDYIAADATDGQSLQQAYDTIKGRYPRINGVIHSAIVLLDRSLENMEEERFQAGLAAKVDVSVRLAQVFQQEPLDFVLFFSSLQSYTKGPGQSNYAAGCTFKDAFAYQLALEWPCPVKVMNWGYWGSVGVVASKAYQEGMAKLGIGSIEPPEAMEALETLMAGTLDQIALLKTTKPMVMNGINIEELVAVNPENPALNIRNVPRSMPAMLKLKQILKASNSIETRDANHLIMHEDKVKAALLKTVSQLLNVKPEDIDGDAKFNEYGFDPLLLTEFVNRLNREYRLELTPAIFFEYPTLYSFTEYLLETYRDELLNDSSAQNQNQKREIRQ